MTAHTPTLDSGAMAQATLPEAKHTSLAERARDHVTYLGLHGETATAAVMRELLAEYERLKGTEIDTALLTDGNAWYSQAQADEIALSEQEGR